MLLQRNANMDVLDNLDNSPELQFNQQLVDICNAGKKTVLLKKDEYFNLIEELKIASAAEPKTTRQYYILRRSVLFAYTFLF